MKFQSIMLFLLLILSSGVCAEVYFSITIDYDDGKLSTNNVKLIESEEVLNLTSQEGDYELTLQSFKGDILFNTRFDIHTELFNVPLAEWFDEEGNQIVIPEGGGDLELEKTSKVLFTPYFNNIKEGIVEKDGIIQLSIDLQEFATCNENNICDNVEDHVNCPLDCKLSFWQKLILWLRGIF